MKIEWSDIGLPDGGFKCRKACLGVARWLLFTTQGKSEGYKRGVPGSVLGLSATPGNDNCGFEKVDCARASIQSRGSTTPGDDVTPANAVIRSGNGRERESEWNLKWQWWWWKKAAHRQRVRDELTDSKDGAKLISLASGTPLGTVHVCVYAYVW